MNEQNNRRNGIAIMRSLIGLIKPLIPIMIFAILLGVLEYLCAISLTILAGFGLIHSSLMLAGSTMDAAVLEAFASHHFTRMAAGMVLIAVLRGLLHYGEQYCNHFIAFKLLAMIRGKVFGALRILCPAKLEGKGKGGWHPWSKRLWKIYASKTFDEVLGSAKRNDQNFRSRCKGSEYRKSSQYGIICYPGNLSVP